MEGVVARDGIEPPTQVAFSGPRARLAVYEHGRSFWMEGVVARDGIEPPTRVAFSGPRARLAHLERGRSFWLEGVVARDGIEPPTPAFSGPRSTTELSGLSANFGCMSQAWIPGGAGEGG